MKNYFSLFSLIALLSFCGVSRAEEKLLVVTDVWAPFVYLEDGAPTGFDYEMMITVFSNLGYKIDFQILPWKRCVYMIEIQEADAILDISLNDNRKKTMYFPQESISDGSSVLFHLEGKHYQYEKLEDLRGLTIGTILGYEYEKDFLTADYFIREPVRSEEQNIQKLILGRIDMFLASKNVGLFNAKKMGLLDKIDFIQTPVIRGYNFVAFSKKSGHEKLAEEFSASLKNFKTTPEYHVIKQKFGRQ